MMIIPSSRLIKTTSCLLALMMSVFTFGVKTAQADEYTNSPHLAQIKLDQAIQQFGNYGRNIAIAFVDTGINPNHAEFTGRILPIHSTCVATNNCASGYIDTNYHGTFVSSVASGGLNGLGGVGVAPQSAIMAVKITQVNGTALTTDLNRGLITAAQRGAHILNLSYGSFFSPSSTPYFAYHNNALVNTLNYTGAVGPTTVIAGGNSGTEFMGNAHQAGLTYAAASRLLFVGSVNNQNQISSFSNKPGSTIFTTTEGYRIPLSSLWLVAPGENITGAHISGSSAYAIGSGTSFSTPQVSGALALLYSRWPVLYRTGGAAKLLLYTATDLGAPGVDNIYGAGLLDLNKAFMPFGKVYVPNLRGQYVDVTQITGSMLSSGAFGALSAIQSRLATINSYDSTGRDFLVNLSGAIQTPARASTITLPHGTQIVGSSYYFADGGGMSYAQVTDTIPDYFDKSSQDETKEFYISMTNENGVTTAGGFGFSATPSFTEALWGHDSSVVSSATKMGISNHLLSLAQGGEFVSYGDFLNDDTRYALSWSQNNTTDQNQYDSYASAVGLGITHKMDQDWDLGFTFNFLSEEDQWFGAKYTNSPVGFGDEHKTMSLGFTSSHKIDSNRHITFDAVMARGNGSDVQNSIIDNVSDVYAVGAGVTYEQKNTFKKNDSFSIQFKQPLRVISGSAQIGTTIVDNNGTMNFQSETVTLKPDGQELNLSLDYSAPINDDSTWSTNLTARHDEHNIVGNDNISAMVSAKIRF